MTKKTYNGQLIHKNGSDNDLYLNKDEKPLNSIIGEDSENYGNYLRVKYWISDEEQLKSDLDEKFMNTYYDIENKDKTSYFEISEYLWRDEIKACKHDLISELTAYIGKYCTLEIDFSKEPQTHDKSYI